MTKKSDKIQATLNYIKREKIKELQKRLEILS